MNNSTSCSYIESLVEFFNYRDSLLHCEGVKVSDITAQHGTPIYVYSRAALEASFRALDGSLADMPHIICYSLKANSNLELIGEALVSDPPAEFNNGQAVTPDPDQWEYNVDTDTWSIAVSRAGAESVDGWVLTFRGPAQNPSRGFYGGPYQLADVQAIALALTGVICTAQIGVDDLSDYTIPETPARIPMRFVVQYEDGRLSHTERTFIIPDFTTTAP